MLLGIVLHAALAFTPDVWVVQDKERHDLFGLLVEAIHGFRMPVFFLMSGFFTAMLWRRRGLNALIEHRLSRVLLPLLAAMVTIGTAMNCVVGFAAESAAEEKGAAALADFTIWADARAGDGGAVERRLAGGADIDEPDPVLGVTPLCWAAMSGHTHVVGLLLDNGADIDARNEDGSAPLHGAAFMGRAETAVLLLDRGADANARNHKGESPLDSSAVDLGVTEYVVKELLQLRFDKDAVTEGRKDAADLLLSRSGRYALDKYAPDDAPKQRDGAAASDEDDEASKGVIPIYWRVVFSQALTIGADPLAGEPGFNLMHTNVFHHLWFLWFLIWLVTGFSVYAVIADRFRWGCMLPGWMVLSPAHLVWLIPLTMCAQWFMGLEGLTPAFGPDTSTGLIPLPHLLIYYAVFFGFGVVYFDHNDGGEIIGRWWWLSLPLGILVVFPLAKEFTSGEFGFGDDIADPGLHRYLSVLLQAAYPWLMTFGFMGLFRLLLKGGRSAVRYISDASYWLYVTHLPLIILAQLAVRNWHLPALVKFALVCVIISGLLLLAYETLVRYTWLGTLLNGPRTRPRRVKVRLEAG